MKYPATSIGMGAVSIVIAAIGAGRAGEACQPIAPVEIERQWEYYKSLSGSRDTGGDEKYQCMQIESTKALVCRTRSASPAHPSIVVRTIVQDSTGISIRTEADTASNCRAFSEMMTQFQELNAKLRDTMQNLSKNRQ